MKKRHIQYSFFLLMVFSAISKNVLAQNFNFKNYSLEDGLSQSEINCIYEDSRGYLWMGTSGGGLDRFDGTNFKSYETKDGLCSQIISAITEAPNGDLWIGSQQGTICIFNGKTFRKIAEGEKEYFSRGRITFLSVDDNNNVLIGKDNGLFLYDGKHIEPLTLAGDTVKEYTVNCFKKDSRNITWIGTSKGVFVLKNRSLIRIATTELNNTSNVTSISEDVYGNLWAIKNNSQFFLIKIVGPSHYQVKTFEVDSLILPEHTKIDAIHFNKLNQLWIASENKGIFKVSDNQIEQFNSQNGLAIENIKNIFEDASGNLWFGTSGGGLIKFTNQAFSYFDNFMGFHDPDIFAINSDKNNNIWIGTQLHGVYKFDGKTVTRIENKFVEDEVRCIHTDKKGIVWFGSTAGIQQYNGTTFTPFDKDPGLKNIRAIFDDSQGNIWIGTKGNNFYIYDAKGGIKKIKDAENAYSFVEDKNGNIWVGTGAGVFVYKNKQLIKHYGVAEGLCNSYAGSMILDKYGNIWVGTDNCVARFDARLPDGQGTKFVSYGVEQGLASGTVYLINADTLGNIWVGTNKGLDRISLNEKGEIAGIHNYGKAEGFKGIECNSRATCIDKNQCLWFGTIKGAIKFNPQEDVNAISEIPITHITDVKLFYTKVDWKEYSDSSSTWFGIPLNATLPYNKDQITIEFSAISKTFPDQLKYSFKLEGFDADWSPADDNQAASYSNLPAGTYTFKVKALNRSGMWSTNLNDLTFTIRSPFWKSWWFICLVLIVLSFSIYGYNYYRKLSHRMYKQRLEKIIRERTSEIIKQRDEKEVLLKEVHHRVKNNLQIINSLINIQSDYVSDEASLELFKEIRNRIRTISLVHEKLYRSEDYININVKEYINMLVENLIETYSFEKKIDLKMDLQVEHFNLNTIIPLGLLLNEVISNSFKYAFNDVENGLIEISLNKTGPDQFTLIIGDNGKGFEKDPFNGDSSTLGLELVKILSDQLNGTIRKMPRAGTYYELTFKPLKD